MGKMEQLHLFIFLLIQQGACGLLLGDFYLDMDVMISKAIATDTSNSFSSKTDPLVCLDSCWNLSKKIQ